MNIEQLNAEYGIADQVKFIEGVGGFPFIKIDNVKASALISIYGGQVLSFQPANEPYNLMFLSNAAYYQAGKSIKGGVPICWPWFGPDPEQLGRPAHGFVRNRLWNVMEAEVTANGECKITLGLTDTPETLAIWPHSFKLSLEITVGESLNLELITHNPTAHTFHVTQALHTYFKVGHIDQVAISGLEGIKYIDKVDNGLQKFQAGSIIIDTEVDRIYQGTHGEVLIDDVGFGRRIRITSTGSKTAVVWNPWAKISAEMGDLKDDDYERFVCVETANAGVDILQVDPGREVRLAANYRIEQHLTEFESEFPSAA
ncbi:D-hexose-6-phosphate mutarotase [Nitrosospira sp. Nsp1]|uniref:D-hexose-6-phosphate mutarotase n=1 Tax=Nitrosospira sp. Nsp1 TaxID=136547 RepID=UPI00088C0882|nr:D-hexose-6-phosphate mutarotase [Nitrosospira sp. Nsp1]SCX45926.1 glucose-6-phosphate 1-epimerase [Nitrosospira sp. Nsp1]